MDQSWGAPQKGKGAEIGDGSLPGDPALPKPLVISYLAAMKFLLIVLALVGFPAIGYILVGADDFVLHLMGIGAFTVAVLFLTEGLTTTSISLEPDRIVKRRLLLGDTVIPSRWAVLTTDQHTIRFHHGSVANLRERITIRLCMISSEAAGELFCYAEKAYQIHLKASPVYGDESEDLQGRGAGKNRKFSALMLAEFNKAAQSYHQMQWCLAFYAAIVVFTVGLSDSFDGLAGALPVYWFRVAFIMVAIALHPLLKRLTGEGRAAPVGEHFPPASWSQRCEKLARNSSGSALVSLGIGFLGLVLFFLSGNLLDFYLFLAVAYLYWADFYPRLSTWVREMQGAEPEVAAQSQAPAAPTVRRRSLQISLVLMGTLAVSSYGESRHYLYKNKQDCLDDWNSDQDCKPPSSGSSHFGTGHYFGPRYVGRSAGMGVRSVGSVSVSRGGFGSLGGFHGSFGG
jgi:uncharacterized membrane protein YbaN (DUF454 family)